MALSVSNSVDASSIAGAIQKYINAEFMNLPKEDYDTPLANTTDAIVGTIPMNKGQAVEFRYFENLTPETNGTDDDVKIYTPDEEGTTGQSMSAVTKILPLGHLSDALKISNFALQTDPIKLGEEIKDQIMTLVRRLLHRGTNSSLVKGISALTDNNDGPPYGFGSLPGALPNYYAGGVSNFSDIDLSSNVTMDDFTQVRSALENDGIQTFGDGTYHAVIEHQVKNQLMKDDPNFRDIVKRHEAMAKDVFVMAKLPAYNGYTWRLQTEGYRTLTSDVGGALTTRKNNGRVTFSHVYGPSCYGYTGLGGKNFARPVLKTQDITVTGTHTTFGFRIPFRSGAINPKRGANIVGTTEFYKTIATI